MKILIAALMVLVALGGSAMAAASSTTQVSASLSSYISLAVPTSISGWTLTQGDNTMTPSGLVVNSNAPWHIFVQSAKNIPASGNDYYGHFWSPSAYKAGLGVNSHGTGFLTNPLVLNAGSGDVPLSDDSAPLESGITLGSTPVSLALKQNVGMTDPAENDYSIVIQFTASN
ncbi:MAG: hypothetical protein ABR985_19875 [Methanotrichaceae archaeon]|jgi:hypothetical protein